MNIGALFSLEDRTALVTGGSRGIGRMIAEAFIAQGARVYVTSRKHVACEETAAALGPSCIALPGDVSSVEGCRALAKTLETRESRLDILVNNAGAAWGAPFAEFPETGWDKVVDLNLKSPFFLTQSLLSLLKASGASGTAAKVINIGSIDGMRLNSWETYSYAASKAGLLHLTRRVAARLVKDNIVVSAISPGAFASDMNRAVRDQADAFARLIPSGRVGYREDIGAAAVYLASRAGDYVVGSTIVVDGGLLNAAVDISLDP